MTRFLTFGFGAPMGSWGDVGAQKIRETATWPQKSAILGMCAAALGIDRNDMEARAPLIGLKLATFSTCGASWVDYHTVSGIPGTTPLSEWELRKARLKPRETDIKIRRHYLSDIQVRVALWAGDTDAVFLDRLAGAFRAPRYPLYVGRRSCPLTGFIPPFLVEAETAEDALRDMVDLPDLTGWMFHADDDPAATSADGEILLVRDQPGREPRAFNERRVIARCLDPISDDAPWDVDFESILK